MKPLGCDTVELETNHAFIQAREKLQMWATSKEGLNENIQPKKYNRIEAMLIIKLSSHGKMTALITLKNHCMGIVINISKTGTDM